MRRSAWRRARRSSRVRDARRGLLLGEDDGPEVLDLGHGDLLGGERLAQPARAERARGDVAGAHAPLPVLGHELGDVRAFLLAEDGEGVAQGAPAAEPLQDRVGRGAQLGEGQRALLARLARLARAPRAGGARASAGLALRSALTVGRWPVAGWPVAGRRVAGLTLRRAALPARASAPPAPARAAATLA